MDKEVIIMFKSISLIFVLVTIGIIIYSYYYYNSITTICDTVNDKWIKYHGDDSKYLISTKNNGVLENTDSLLMMKYDSSNFYAKIHVGEHYCFKVVGWRIPFLSWYKNIIEVV